MKFYSATSDTIETPVLPEQKLVFKKIPFWLIRDAVDFLRLMWFKQGTETGIVLLFDNETQQFSFHVPKQKASYTSLDWINGVKTTGIVGTIHSHCDFSGRFSGLDFSTNENVNGLHLVFGNLDGEVTWEAQFTVTPAHKLHQDKDFVMDDVIDGFSEYSWQLNCPELFTKENIENVEKTTLFATPAKKVKGYNQVKETEDNVNWIDPWWDRADKDSPKTDEEAELFGRGAWRGGY